MKLFLYLSTKLRELGEGKTGQRLGSFVTPSMINIRLCLKWNYGPYEKSSKRFQVRSGSAVGNDVSYYGLFLIEFVEIYEA